MTTLSSLISRGGSSLSSFSDLQSISADSLEVPLSWFVENVVVDGREVRGRGSYGTVYVAHWQGTKVAVKKLHDIFFEKSVAPEGKKGILKTFAREVNLLFQLRHPNIVQFFGVYKASGNHTLELSSDTYLVQELMCCALDVRNRMHPRLNFRNIVDISVGITSALQYLHNRVEPIIHRDLASKNVLLSYSGAPKLADLGVAKIMESGHTVPLTRQPGTEIYMPPEVKMEGVPYNTKLDIYSFGVILLEICNGCDGTAGEAFRAGPSGSVFLIPEIERRSKDFEALGNHILKPLIVKCLSSREERPAAEYITNILMDLQESPEYTSSHGAIIVPALKVEGSINQEELAARCQSLESKVSMLEADKQHLAHKLDLYIRSEREDWGASLETSKSSSKISEEIEKLKEENASLHKVLAQKDSEISELSSFSSPPSSLTDPQMRDQRATLMLKINELQASKQREVDHLHGQIMALRTENISLQNQIRATIRGQHSSAGQQHPNGPSSLPEFPLPSSQLPDMSSLKISSSSSSSQSEVATMNSAPSAELKKLKKLLERYKTANIELDMKLKAAKLDLEQYENRHTDSDIVYRLDVEQLRAENARLQSQLDSALNDNFRLQRELSAACDRRPY